MAFEVKLNYVQSIDDGELVTRTTDPRPITDVSVVSSALIQAMPARGFLKSDVLANFRMYPNGTAARPEGTFTGLVGALFSNGEAELLPVNYLNHKGPQALPETTIQRVGALNLHTIRSLGEYGLSESIIVLFLKRRQR